MRASGAVPVVLQDGGADAACACAGGGGEVSALSGDGEAGLEGACVESGIQGGKGDGLGKKGRRGELWREESDVDEIRRYNDQDVGICVGPGAKMEITHYILYMPRMHDSTASRAEGMC